MKYKTKKLENKNLEIEISLSKEEWEKAVENSFNKNKGKYTVEGFRKGKAPRKVIEKVYGMGVFYDDAINDSFFDAYEEILNKEFKIVLRLFRKPALTRANNFSLLTSSS